MDHLIVTCSRQRPDFVKSSCKKEEFIQLNDNSQLRTILIYATLGTEFYSILANNNSGLMWFRAADLEFFFCIWKFARIRLSREENYIEGVGKKLNSYMGTKRKWTFFPLINAGNAAIFFSREKTRPMIFNIIIVFFF